LFLHTVTHEKQNVNFIASILKNFYSKALKYWTVKKKPAFTFLYKSA